MKSADVVKALDTYGFKNYGRYPIALQKAKGCWVWDFEGNKYLDFTTGIAVNNLGHNHPKIKKAISSQLNKIIHSSNLFYTEEQARLAELLVKNSFADRVFFCNSGAEANEAAIKLARKWGKDNGGRYKIVSAKGGFHGRSYGSLSITGHKKYRDGFEPMVPGVKFVDYGNFEQLEKAAKDKKVCAVILEPIQGENGVIIPPKGYLKKVRKLCTQNNILFILDEIQVGIGRTGSLFAYEQLGIKPDLMTLAKALGGGLACGALLAKNKHAKYLTPGSHGSTMGGNPLAMRVGCAVINTIIEDGLLDNVQSFGSYFVSSLKEIQSQNSKIIKDVRGQGFIIGIELANNILASEIVKRLYEKGLLTIITEQKNIRILPPLTAGKKEIDFALKTIRAAIKEVQDV
ncbi:MAG: aspartate aminotransferase family protein [Candidatus Dadabacteria bacterium]|nr:aspartate aminotransferase family protein [Candidatus Dadabacteria bacterium]NIS09911.1 aspartate aminotransferase family protein [Candidatus Dadabacteria bacterium]NIV41740.1 acetylornithine/succinylornithine family transaminase [Candidatus Dadabacteria bacterium]NIX16336.1 acetylornithine/succinylornithine family transaminase [Candidatus Dadabacteria bacterium]NIY21157.1 acetylornithine/succinylornithine family transaminase [Candidatus Dadabacteria bacterium]